MCDHACIEQNKMCTLQLNRRYFPEIKELLSKEKGLLEIYCIYLILTYFPDYIWPSFEELTLCLRSTASLKYLSLSFIPLHLIQPSQLTLGQLLYITKKVTNEDLEENEL